MSVQYTVFPGNYLSGTVVVPGDKSISHRAIMLASLSDGMSQIEGFLESDDALSTLNAFVKMGVKIDKVEAGVLRVHGVGLRGLKAPSTPLDLGNAGTAMRLMAGLMSAQLFDTLLIGDASLSQRPMARIIKPLLEMGAHISADHLDFPPLKIQGNHPLRGIRYPLPIASAQIKSCVLLAGLYAQGKTTVVETSITRDHTERMLATFSYPVVVKGSDKTVIGGQSLKSTQVNIPADISSAAFFIVAAILTPQSKILLKAVGMNPTRSGIITILQKMGASIQLHNKRNMGFEPVADIEVCYSELKGIDIPVELVPISIDEFPIIFIAAACASGITRLTQAQELRVKESDRLEAMSQGLSALGIHHTTQSDGIEIEGGCFQGGEVDSFGDHRIAMAFAIAGINASAPVSILNCDSVSTSFPDFVQKAQQIGINIIESHPR